MHYCVLPLLLSSLFPSPSFWVFSCGWYFLGFYPLFCLGITLLKNFFLFLSPAISWGFTPFSFLFCLGITLLKNFVLTRPNSQSGSPPKTPKSNYKAFYTRAPDELLNECTSLTSFQDLENHRGNPTCITSMLSAALMTRTSPFVPADRGNLCVWMTGLERGVPSSLCTRRCSNASGCASHSRPLRGNSSPRLTPPPPNSTPKARHL